MKVRVTIDLVFDEAKIRETYETGAAEDNLALLRGQPVAWGDAGERLGYLVNDALLGRRNHGADILAASARTIALVCACGGIPCGGQGVIVNGACDTCGTRPNAKEDT